MRAEPVRVAVWGLGPHAVRKVVPAVVACDATALAGVVTRDRAVAAEVAASHACRAWDDPAAMLADPAVDAVYLATPIGLHHDQGARVLGAGKHLWCEKSLVASVDEARALVELSRDRDLALCETFMYRHHPHYRTVLDLVRGEAIGEVRSVTCRFGIPALERPGYRLDPALGGGALLDVGCYAIDAARGLLGDDLAVVEAAVEPRRPDEVDAEGYAVLWSATGARAYLEWGYGLAYRNELLVWGRDGALETDRIFSKPADLAPTIVLGDRHGARRALEVPARDSFVAMLERLAATATDAAAREAERQAAAAQARLVGAVRAAALR